MHLYGVDRMSTKECLQYFGDYGPSGVEWLDDSSCNVMFADADSAKRAIIGMGRPFGPGEAPDLQGQAFQPSTISSTGSTTFVRHSITLASEPVLSSPTTITGLCDIAQLLNAVFKS